MLVTVATYLEPAEAHVVRGRLEADGIPAHLANDGLVTLNWPWATALGGVHVQVSGDDVEAARAVVSAYQRGELMLDATFVDEAARDIAAGAEWSVEPSCPRCAAPATLGVPVRQKLLSLLTFLLGSASFPTRRSAARCTACGLRWSID